MTAYCLHCFGKLDALHSCDSITSATEGDHSDIDIWDTDNSLSKIVIWAPIAGILLDFILPFPSSILNSLLLSIIGSALFAGIWVAIKFEVNKTPKFFIFNAKNLIYTPSILKIFGSNGVKKTTTFWLAVVLFSSAIQLVVLTPGNSSYIAHQVTKKIDSASGANLKVDCPGTKLYLYNEKIECRVKTGIFGISVPARVKISPLFGSADIKISIL